MARRKPVEDTDNHERWLVSYADLVSLLFAFFVMMYAIASADKEQQSRISPAIGAAFGKPPATGVVDAGSAVVAFGAPQPELRPRQEQQERRRLVALRREREHMSAVARDIRSVLAPLVEQGQVRITESSRGIGVEINASVLFAPGEARLGAESSKALVALAAVMKQDTHAIHVEGHTDNQPIRNSLFPSNWELSAVRATSVVRLLIDNGVDGARLTALGFGEHQPLADNATVQGRMRNRRVQLMILSAATAPSAETGKPGAD